MNDAYTQSLLERMVNINSVFPDEKEVLLFIEAEFRALGIETIRYPVTESRWNIRARIGSGGPVVCLNAHADTMPINGHSVPRARIENGIMYGLGSADDKGAIVAMMTAMKEIKGSGRAIKGTLDVLVSVDEEADGLGVRAAVDGGYRCDLAIVGEPSSLEIMPLHTGMIFLKVVTHGKSAHGALPWVGENAIDKLTAIVNELRPLVESAPPHPVCGPPTLNLGQIQGGDRPNRVPDRCEAAVDIRFVAPMVEKAMLESIKIFFAGRGPGVEYSVTKVGGTLNTGSGSRLVTEMAKAVRGVTGREAVLSSMRGWTEADIFQSRLGIDAVVYGPGSIKQAHSANEFVHLADVFTASRVYQNTALALLS